VRDFLDLVQPAEGYTEVRRIMDGKVKQHWFEQHAEVSDLSLTPVRSGLT
jgi:hypothetical protein